ncbi:MULTISPECIES: alpha/beta hydrolase [unclassified Mycobacterium]|uniref:alpha/beta fold hydrolase n=1 Tax=unclassified Mycobacterium TaxID=2642494 RepID=UPI0029C8E7FD|nr:MULTISPECIES: alpha/beta hydrolase [unclassified Mycobacterium]
MVHLGDVELAVDIRGVGSPLVLIHGFAGDRHTWDGLWEALSIGRRVVRYDLRDFGESLTVGDTPYRHADDLKRLLDRLGIGQCDVLGLSMGGGVAIDFALRHPETVDRVLLVSPSLMGWDWSDSWRQQWDDIVELAKEGNMPAARRSWWQHPLFETTRRNTVTAEQLWKSIEGYSGHHWSAIDRQELLAVPHLEQLHELAAKTLLVSGGLDLPEFLLMADLIEATVPHLERFDYPHAGHLVTLEFPQQLASDVNAYLDRRPSLLTKS